jgi:hypothetical protein
MYVMKKIFLIALLTTTFFFPSLVTYSKGLKASEFDFDLDSDGQVLALTDGLLLIRYLFGFEDKALVKGAVGSEAERTSGRAIYDFIEINQEALDVDLDGKAGPLTDGLLVIRYLFGFSGESLTAQAVGENAGRSAAKDIVAELEGAIDRDGDGFTNARDLFPNNPGEWFDTDGDGIGDNEDADDDGDGVQDLADAFPLDRLESVDTDSDGIGNSSDFDDDNDGVLDDNDWAPLDPSETMDSDGDGIGPGLISTTLVR